jgi:hypothetical protein
MSVATDAAANASANASPIDNNFLGAVIVGPLVVGLVVGIVLWWVAKNSEDKKIKSEAIRDLMAYRGDYSSAEFRRALNKVSITFHSDPQIRKEIRELYEALNTPLTTQESVNRKIVGLIYNLCQKNGFKGITEYDIDQSFPEASQVPTGEEPSTTSIPSHVPQVMAAGVNEESEQEVVEATAAP